MKIATSLLSIQAELDKIRKIDALDTDLIHLDVMDGQFVPAVCDFSSLDFLTKPLDVHLMTQDVKKYTDIYEKLHPIYITFHLEVGNTRELISYIKGKNIKVGISIKPETKVEELLPYLSEIDLVLVMSVEPGKGEQTFMESAGSKIEELKKYKEKYGNYEIEVDGGIGSQTASYCRSADILVVGSFITKARDYKEALIELRKNL